MISTAARIGGSRASGSSTHFPIFSARTLLTHFSRGSSLSSSSSAAFLWTHSSHYTMSTIPSATKHTPTSQKPLGPHNNASPWPYAAEPYKRWHSDICTRGHYFQLPVDWDAHDGAAEGAGEKVTVFGYEVVDKNKVALDLPWLVYFQGGPGVPGVIIVCVRGEDLFLILISFDCGFERG